jgi:hypothetical protein
MADSRLTCPAALRRGLQLLLVTVSILLAVAAGAARGATPAPGWSIHTLAAPAVFSVSDNEHQDCSEASGFTGCDSYQVTVTNVGDKEADGTPIVITDHLPAAVEVKRVALFFSPIGKSQDINTPEFGGPYCSLVPLRCQFPVMPVDAALRIVIYVTVRGGPETLTNTAEVEGGGGASKKVTTSNPLGGPSPPFGASQFEALFAGPSGEPETQAGAHPYEFTTRIDFSSAFQVGPDANFGINSVEDPKDVVVDLPVGVLGSAKATPTCTFSQLSSHINNGEGGCPSNTVIGHIFSEPITGESVDAPIYNMQPQQGEAAEFGYLDLLAGPHVIFSHVVPTPAGYTLRAVAPELPQVPLTSVVTTFYGDPAAKEEERTHSKSVLPPIGFFTMPSYCSAQPLTTTVHIDSWQKPARMTAGGDPDLSDPRWASVGSAEPAVTGCNRLRFEPTLSFQPNTSVADSPAGAELHIGLAQNEQFDSLAAPPLRNTLVTLPPGLAVDPSAAQGLGACTPSEIDLQSAASPTCPEASKIGTVSVTTPLLPGALEGSVYLASQYANPFGSLLAAYIVIDDPQTGIVAKIPGKFEPDATAGQITATFDDAPQLPFSDLTMTLKGGSRGVLATPERCGTFSTDSVLSPWSAPYSGPDASLTATFAIDTGCASGFAPTLTAGASNPQAGVYSPLVISFARADTDQELSSATVTLPAGLSARLAGVERCADSQVAQAAANPSGIAEQHSPSCPAGSQVGTVKTAVGPGTTPFVATGKAYLTGPYKGAPFGLAIVVPAVAGPFDLGNVVVRTALYIDPVDGHVTAVSDRFPAMINQTGIPVRLRRVDITLDREGFTFNPTNCEPAAIVGALTSNEGSHADLSPRFQIGNCAALAFHPKLSATTQANGEIKRHGASLDVKISTHQGPGGGEANIRKVEVALPSVLPSRLTTLQKSCTERQFAANPAGCPRESEVGTAIARTPVLSSPVSGPAYLVSHGTEAFPDLVLVLQGEGITLELTGHTQIKKGVTYSRFETVPDQPVSNFELKLPEGSFSALAAVQPPCGRTVTTTRRVHRRGHTVRVKATKHIATNLSMPTTITGQNGAVIHQATKIAVTGCPKARTSKRRTHTLHKHTLRKHKH